MGSTMDFKQKAEHKKMRFTIKNPNKTKKAKRILEEQIKQRKASA